VTGFWLLQGSQHSCETAGKEDPYHWTPPATAMAEQPVPIGMLRPETLTPMSALTSAATPGVFEFSTHWQHWGVPVVEPEPPFGAATARVAKPARAMVKTLANMVIAGVLRRVRGSAGC
jgi:hypothetical protein